MMAKFAGFYTAVIGDIKASRKLEHRGDVQKKLAAILDKINGDYASDIAAKFKITLGDEFQGLLYCSSNVIKIIQFIEMEMYPVQLRYGIGVGEITTDIDPDIPLGADGPAYYHARKAIDHLKEMEQKKKSMEADTWIELQEEEQDLQKLLNTLLSLTAALKRNWSDRQYEIIKDYICHQDTQKNVAERLGITQSSVQKGLAAAEYYTYQEALDRVTGVLTQIGENDV